MKKIEELYHQALARPKADRAAFLAEACAGDESLHRELASMLGALEKAEGFLELPALEHAARLAGQAGSQSLAGHQLGPFRIGALLGRGGMGEVYRAIDTRLDRPVALKLLPAEVSGNPERLRRFVREAKAASSLNHPNIATIHEIGESDGIHWIAMELVEGQTLADRLAVGADPRVRPQAAIGTEPHRTEGAHRGAPLRLDLLLDISIQTAEALEAAHKKGIIHRDIKPANIMLTLEEKVKVLDFGLAKRLHLEQPPQDMPASTESYTVSGLIMGTVDYMSPEQVLGHEVDQRTDLFSLGVVLYNMVAGRLPFHGASSTETMDQILHAEPEAMARFNHTVPTELERIVRKCLEKDQTLRYQHASDLCTDLRRLKRDKDSGKMTAETSKPKPHRGLLWAMVILLVAVIATTGLWFFQGRNETIEAPMMPVPFTTDTGHIGSPSISPDGKQVAFAWDKDPSGNRHNIYIKQIGSETPRQLTVGSHDDWSPAWSPDGLSIVFRRILDRDKVAVVLIPSNGGRERQVAEYQDVGGICWHPGGRWLAVGCKDSPAEPFAILLLSLETGEKRRLTSPAKEISRGLVVSGDTGPAFSPDGRRLAFSRSFAGPLPSEIFVLRVSSKLEPEGIPKQLTFGDRWASMPAWMPDGKELVIVYGSKVHYCSLWRISISDSDKLKPLPFSGEGSVFRPSVSPETHRLIYGVQSFDFKIWRYRIPGSNEKPAPPSRFIHSTQTQEDPQYSPDGKEVAFVSYASGNGEIWISNSDGTNPLQLTHSDGPVPEWPRWSPDGKRIIFSRASHSQAEIFWIPAQGGQARQLTHTPFNKSNPSYSRYGKWVYFRWDRGGDAQIWKMPADGGEPVQATKYGGSVPLESMDGKTLFYLKGNDVLSSLWVVPVGGGEETKVLDDVLCQNFDVKTQGIYCTSGTDQYHGRFFYYDLASRKTKLLAPIQDHVEWGLTVSADEGWILLTKGDSTGSNLMLVENFR